MLIEASQRMKDYSIKTSSDDKNYLKGPLANEQANGNNFTLDSAEDLQFCAQEEDHGLHAQSFES